MTRALAALALLVACGDNLIPAQPDAPPTVAVGDVAVTTAVRCCILGAPQAGVEVEVVQPDGSAGDRQVTDASGNATLHDVIPGASVTAIYPASVDDFVISHAITTFLAVQPGDHLTFGSVTVRPQGPMIGMMRVEFPMWPGASEYIVITPCGPSFLAPTGTTSEAFDVQLRSDCAAPTAPIGFLVQDGFGNISASASLPAAPFTAGGTAVLTSWTPSNARLGLEIDGLTNDIVNVSLDASAVFPGGPSYSLFATSSGPTGSSSIATSVSVPTTAQRLVGHALMLRGDGPGIESFRSVTANAPAALLARPLVPWIDGLTANAALGQARFLVGSGSYDAAVLSLSWSRQVDTMLDSFKWILVVPTGVTEVALPAPPGLPPLPGPTENLGATLELIELPTAASYDELRRVPEWQITVPQAAVFAGDLASAEVSE